MPSKTSIAKRLTVVLFVLVSIISTNWIAYGETALTLRFFSPWDTPEPPPPDTPTPSIPTVTALGDLNIRSGPGIEYDVVGFMRGGDSAIVVGTTAANWWKIECPVHITGAECWVSGNPRYSSAKNTENIPWVSVPPTPSPIPATATPVPPTQTSTPTSPSLTAITSSISESPTPDPDTIANNQISEIDESNSNDDLTSQTVTQEPTSNPSIQPTEEQPTTPNIYYGSVALIAISFLVLGLAIGLILRRKS